MKSFEFIITLLLVRKILAYVNSLTREIRREKLDIVLLLDSINIIIDTSEDVNMNLDEHHHNWFLEACEIANKLQVEVNAKKSSSISVSDYFKQQVFCPFMDYIVNCIRERFSDEHKVHFYGCFIIPSNIFLNKCENIWKEHVIEFGEKYRTDLPSPFVLNEELQSWKMYWESELSRGIRLPVTIKETLLSINGKKQWFPNIYNILIIIATCPGTSVSSERSFSKLKT